MRGGSVMIFEMPECGGCRTCEILCSYHHNGVFEPSVSSIRILDKKSNYGFFVELIDDSDGETIACDGCKGLEAPLCTEFCEKSEQLSKIIAEFIRTGNSKKIKEKE